MLQNVRIDRLTVTLKIKFNNYKLQYDQTNTKLVCVLAFWLLIFKFPANIPPKWRPNCVTVIKETYLVTAVFNNELATPMSWLWEVRRKLCRSQLYTIFRNLSALTRHKASINFISKVKYSLKNVSQYPYLYLHLHVEL